MEEREMNIDFYYSPTIAKLAEALSKAQGSMPTPVKKKFNPHFKSYYADLSEIIDCTKPHLSQNGIAVIQGAGFRDGRVVITTMLCHSSGEWVTSELSLQPDRATPQGVGSSITYARRYALSAMLNIAADDDDDGNSASSIEAPKEEKRQQAAPKPPAAPAVKKKEEQDLPPRDPTRRQDPRKDTKEIYDGDYYWDKRWLVHELDKRAVIPDVTARRAVSQTMHGRDKLELDDVLKSIFSDEPPKGSE